MAKVAYFDCPTGIAGDMCLGAIVDAGVPLDYLTDQLARLGISHEYTLRTETVQRNGQRATKIHVDLADFSHGAPVPAPLALDTFSLSSANHPSHHPHSHCSSQGTRHLPDIEALIQSAHLPSRVTEWSLRVFQQLAKAEGAVHGIAPGQVHFHEVGATDAIADIVGTCIGLDWLEIDHLFCSALPIGGGTIWAAHGHLPVPAPAVLHLLKMGQVPIYSNGINRELVTPTGAAIATSLATSFGPPPNMILQSIGLGAGGRELMIPNILRLWIGESTPLPQSAQMRHSSSSHSQSSLHHDHFHDDGEKSPYETQTIMILETHLDDLNPQIMGYLLDQLLAIGVLDVFTQAVGMKKSRPGILLTVLCLPEHREACEALIYQETTTLGIRRRQQERSILHRELQTVSTPYGTVTLKLAFDKPQGTLLNIKPEHADCARLAQEHQVSLSTVNDAAFNAAYHPRA